MSDDLERRLDQAQLRLYRDRRLAHAVLFGGTQRHASKTPPFHSEIIDDFHSKIRHICWIAFRGSAKTTLIEEGTTIEACFGEFRHCLIIGSNLDQAAARLHTIRRQLENNENLQEIFGNLRSRPWGDELIELSNGVTIQAMGRGQAIRGTKSEDIRPDLMIVDDIEDDESVASEQGREKNARWFDNELLPAGDAPSLRVRMASNDLHPDCIANKLDKPGSGFVVKRYPWIFLGSDGVERATWPDRFPLASCHQMREQMYSRGRGAEYESNYMCRSERPETRPFRPDMLKVVPRQRVWEACYCMIDPARTVRKGSATTGWAVWSWLANRLIVWELGAKAMMPDEIISLLFRLNATYSPVTVGFEEDGLNEWALQPIRAEARRRGVALPLKPVKAPKSKLDFIRGLQVYFQAGEIEMVERFAEPWAQFLGFPTGTIDAPNALAYALHAQMKSGLPIYEDFSTQNIASEIGLDAGPAWLALNADGAQVTAALCQITNGCLRIVRDWIMEGDPGDVLPGLVGDACVEAERQVRLIGGPSHGERYSNVGLAQAARSVPGGLRIGAQPVVGRAETRRLLRQQSRGMPALLVSAQARATLNAFAGGYCRSVLKGGSLADEAEPGSYRLLMEGIESFAGLLRMGATDEGDDGRLNAVTAGGTPYHSARPRR